MGNTYTEMENESNKREMMLYKDVDESALERFRTPPYYKVIMAKEKARKYFTVVGLSYDKISIEKLELLQSILKEELIQQKKTSHESARYIMRIIKMQPNDVMFEKGRLEYAYLKVKSGNFDERESISFNRNGFISFGGRAGSKNITRILKGFMKWCDFIKE